ncbi:MAG: Gfo/Idh/MocA family oxidoreductase [Verrucomicrobia bacterium]|nr:Gfo/Idh/MocA family oxidoreductase [Verrucomicrobiota bacterium]
MNSTVGYATTSVSRRQFIAASGAAAAALTAAPGLQAQGNSAMLRVGLIGCGGRGTGAASQALHADSDVKLVAMGDAFADRIKLSLETLKKDQEIASKVAVPEENQFTGLDAYQKVIEKSDVVLLTTPPGFRPIHIKAAVDAGKHVFAEKPVAVDAPGVRSVLATCEEARRKKLAVVSGLCIRYSYGFQEIIKRIHNGALGRVRTLQANDFRGPIWVKPREPGQTDMQYQIRNWYYFTWLSGDFNVEQHVHMLDVCAWVMNGEYPATALGIGGRAQRTGPDFGNIYDHHAVIYEWANGTRLHAYCRQQSGLRGDISVHVAGEKGIAKLAERDRGLVLETGDRWAYDGPKNNIYQTEHDELFASIRKGQPINNGDYMCKSTLMAIMGRMATYTGQQITWEQAMNSKENLSPDGWTWDSNPPKSPVAVPGVTKFV